ncbi:MAG: hypothetical protein LBD60_00955 [Puniceicoccales bacterium]|jgi:hypothetical protein|nr:hypothetical protein [Puniceicoccales bacterium]
MGFSSIQGVAQSQSIHASRNREWPEEDKKKVVLHVAKYVGNNIFRKAIVRKLQKTLDSYRTYRSIEQKLCIVKSAWKSNPDLQREIVDLLNVPKTDPTYDQAQENLDIAIRRTWELAFANESEYLKNWKKTAFH